MPSSSSPTPNAGAAGLPGQPRYEFVDQLALDDFRFLLSCFPWYARHASSLAILASGLPGILLALALQARLVPLGGALLILLLVARALSLQTGRASLAELDASQLLPTRHTLYEDYLETDDGRELIWRAWRAFRGCDLRAGRLVLPLSNIIFKLMLGKSLGNEGLQEVREFAAARIGQQRAEDAAVALPAVELTDEFQVRFGQTPLEVMRCRMATGSSRRDPRRMGPGWALLFYAVPFSGCMLWFLLAPRIMDDLDLFNEILALLGFLVLLTVAGRGASHLLNWLSFGAELKLPVDVTARIGNEGLVMELPHARMHYRWSAIQSVRLVETGQIAVLTHLPSLVAAIPTRAFESELDQQRWMSRVSGFLEAEHGSAHSDSPNAAPRPETGNPYQPPPEI